MDIDLINDLRQADEEDSDESDEKRRKPSKNDEDDEDEGSKNADLEKVMKKANEVAKKKVARRPRPKLDVDRLVGPRGIGDLCALFKDEKFKGKGNEFADLDVMMHKFEYWAHRLVPHMAFDDFIEKAENLGTKKAVKHRLQNLRSEYATKTNLDDDEQASTRLLDLLPLMNPVAQDSLPVDITNHDIPNDDELNELFE